MRGTVFWRRRLWGNSRNRRRLTGAGLCLGQSLWITERLVGFGSKALGAPLLLWLVSWLFRLFAVTLSAQMSSRRGSAVRLSRIFPVHGSFAWTGPQLSTETLCRPPRSDVGRPTSSSASCLAFESSFFSLFGKSGSGLSILPIFLRTRPCSHWFSLVSSVS